MSRTKRPKVVRRDCLTFQHTLVDLILSALANRGEPSLFDHVPDSNLLLQFMYYNTLAVSRLHIVMWTNFELDRLEPPRSCRIRLNREHIGPVSIESNSAPSRDNTNNFAEQMENNDRTLKELATPDVVYQPWCIQYPQLEPAQTYELKSGLIHLLPKFHGLAGEDPHKHLKEFLVFCSTGAIGGTERLHQDEGIPILPGWSSKRLAVSTANSIQYLGRYDVYVLGEVLFGIQNRDHQEGNMRDQATLWRNSA
ncbi:hypothetical protein CR513_28225, partial [Mucuna pruriens]